jgi:hypothetical protein
LLFGFTRFGAGDGGFHGGLARVDGFGCGLRRRRGLLFGFARFGAGDSGFNGGFARVDGFGRAASAGAACCSALRALARAIAASTAALRGSTAGGGLASPARPAVRLCALWRGR